MHVLLRGSLTQRLRLGTGLILFVYALTHFANHALGLVGVPAMLAFQEIRTGITRSLIGTTILLLAIGTHMALGIAKVLRRKTLRMPVWEAVQIISGLAIPYFLAAHVVFTGVAARGYDVKDSYLYQLALLWPGEFIKQTVLLLVVWVHGCIGLHFWLRLAPWYGRVSHLLSMLAAALPVLAIAGFATAGRSVRMLLSDPDELALLKTQSNWPSADVRGDLIYIYQGLEYVVLAVVAGIALVFLVKWLIAWNARTVPVRYVHGPNVEAPAGPTLLEISRMFSVPHRSVCGGRGRCSTCRVRVTDGIASLDSPNAVEAATLAAIGAPEQVRLACQIRPRSALEALRLLATATSKEQETSQGRFDDGGREQRCTILFLDVRGFTELSQDRLPYDVVFLLNQLFERIGKEIGACNGWIDKYLGDGLMAVFGTDGGEGAGALDALRACQQIDLALDEINHELASELTEPLTIGMGVHTGVLVMGRIGAASSASTTVIGKTVNIAARLEGLSKSQGAQLVVSADVLSEAAVRPGGMPLDAELRGIDETVPVFVYARGRDLVLT